MPEFSEKETYEGVKCVGETAKAILVDIDGTRYWVPQSQVDNDSEVYKKGDVGDLVVSRWYAEKEGLGERRRR